MMNEEKCNDIIQKMLFFNSRAGREVWADKPREVQDQDIKNREADLKFLQTEIEQLKSENEQFRKLRILGNEATIEFHDDVVSEPSADYKDIEKYAKQFRNRIISINEKEIKQAKIEVLNELKERIKTAIDTYWNSNGGGYYLAEDAIGDIDDLIEEVENEQKD